MFDWIGPQTHSMNWKTIGSESVHLALFDDDDEEQERGISRACWELAGVNVKKLGGKKHFG